MIDEKPTLDWLRKRALTVLAELMTSDDDQIALRAAETTLTVLREHEEDEEQQIGVRYNREGTGAWTDRSRGPTHDSRQQGAFSGGSLRAALGQDRSGEDRGD